MNNERVKSQSPTQPLPMLPRVVHVDADASSRTILAVFENGERRRFDVSPLLDEGVFRLIADPSAFSDVAIDEMGGVEWKAGPDLSRDTVYLRCEVIG